MLVNEIFYSLQGEGYFSGTPSLFIRFSGCNLKCGFCDTQHQHGTEMTEEDIVERARACKAQHVVITGGEPSLQLTESLVDELHKIGKFVAVETNGTRPLPENVDWITLSPKDAFVFGTQSKIVLKRCNELKVVFTGTPPADYSMIDVAHYFLQPCDMGDEAKNKEILEGTINYCLVHPQWHLSLQMHKLIGLR